MSATPAQLDLINSLIRQRDVSPALAAQIRELVTRQEVSSARGGPVSQVIDRLLALPSRDAPPAAPSFSQRLKDAPVPISNYAIPADEIPSSLRSLLIPSASASASASAGLPAHAFLAVQEFKDTRYVRRLDGAHPRFNRVRIDAPTTTPPVLRAELHDFLIDTLSLAAAQLFGTLYSCCAVCGAELTDATSRALKLGPTCRNRFSL